MSKFIGHEPRCTRNNERIIPTHGDWGGPLCCIIAKYEDGTEIQFGHEVMKQYEVVDESPKFSSSNGYCERCGNPIPYGCRVPCAHCGYRTEC